jgi:hypothetical protein
MTNIASVWPVSAVQQEAARISWQRWIALMKAAIP